jgi:hypothetical protein
LFEAAGHGDVLPDAAAVTAARWTAPCLAHLALGMNPPKSRIKSRIKSWTSLRRVDTMAMAKKK